MILLIRYFLSIFFSGILFYQSNAQYQALKIGDKVPDIVLEHFLDNPAEKLKISDLKGKLLILDFWNTRCSVCINGMPKMDSLQKKFGDRLQIIAVTGNNEQQVNQLFSKIKIKRPGFPFIISDTILKALFPHDGDPLHVWINPKGIVAAITFHFNTNFETVGEFLNGIDPHLTRRWDFGVNEDYNLISEQNSNIMGLSTNYSVLFRGLDEYTIETSIRIDSGRIQMINATLPGLFSVAYYYSVYGFPVNFFNLRSNNRMILEVNDSTPFIPPSDESKEADWIKKYQFSYELKFPAEKQNEKFKYMQEDLGRYFPFKASVEKRKVKCLVLMIAINAPLLITKDPFDKPFTGMKPDKSFQFTNSPVTRLITELIYANPDLKIPIVGETYYNFNIDLTIRSKLSDIESVKKELNFYGLDLVEKEKIINMLVIRDK